MAEALLVAEIEQPYGQKRRVRGLAFESDGLERALASGLAAEIHHFPVEQAVAVTVEFCHRPYRAAGGSHPDRKLSVGAVEEEAPDAGHVESPAVRRCVEDQHAVARTELRAVVRRGPDGHVQLVEPVAALEVEAEPARLHAAFLEYPAAGGKAVFHRGVGAFAAVCGAQFEDGAVIREDVSVPAEADVAVILEREAAFGFVSGLYFKGYVGLHVDAGGEFPGLAGGVGDLHA